MSTRIVSLIAAFKLPYKCSTPIVESQQKVLLSIALQGPQTKYHIEHKSPKEIGKLSHFSVVDAVNKLEDEGALQGENIGKTRTGQEKIKWHLTFHGLLLCILNVDPEYYGQISRKWGYLEPVILGRWDFFAQENKLGKQKSSALLYHAAFCGIDEDLSLDEFREVTIGSVLDGIRDMFDLYAGVAADDPESKKLYEETYEQSRPEDELEKWLSVFREDVELEKYLQMYIVGMYEEGQSCIDWSEMLKQWIAGERPRFLTK